MASAENDRTSWTGFLKSQHIKGDWPFAISGPAHPFTAAKGSPRDPSSEPGKTDFPVAIPITGSDFKKPVQEGSTGLVVFGAGPLPKFARGRAQHSLVIPGCADPPRSGPQ